MIVSDDVKARNEIRLFSIAKRILFSYSKSESDSERINLPNINNFIPYDKEIYITFIDTCNFELSLNSKNVHLTI